jgi:hypothetical protein
MTRVQTMSFQLGANLEKTTVQVQQGSLVARR